jgi:hypothetical protein
MHDQADQLSVVAHSYPYDYWHDRYQETYWKALQARLGEQRFRTTGQGSIRNEFLRILRRARYSSRLRPKSEQFRENLAAALDAVARYGGALSPTTPTVGHYSLKVNDSRTIEFLIDSSDSGDLMANEHMLNGRVLFKTNYWPTKTYPRGVLPLFNGNPIVYRHLKKLVSLRNLPAEYDFCLIVRVWGGKNETDGVEHCLRILEAANKHKGKKFLYGYLVAGNIEESQKRLTSQGIACGTQPVPMKTLWAVSARSRFNVIRLGMHDCMPWRFIDLMAMGAAPILDRAPFTQWPEELREETHYLQMNVHPSITPVMPTTKFDYSIIPAMLDSYLSDPSIESRVRRSAALYFDKWLTPQAAGDYILQALHNATHDLGM